MLDRLGCTGPCGDVVEFGCGYGTFTIPAAQSVTGTVHAIDIDSAMIEATRKRAEEVGLTNVLAATRDIVADGTGLPNDSVGYAMLFNLLHIEEPVSLLREARRVLVPGGTAGIIHWRTDVATPRGPSMPIRPTVEQCRAWGEAAGLEHVQDVSLCCCSWHWGLLMLKPRAA
jgi:ubiquinone/menaquinone biosynthesis C-methylase UbiE